MPEDFKMGNGMLFAKYWDFVELGNSLVENFIPQLQPVLQGPLSVALFSSGFLPH